VLAVDCAFHFWNILCDIDILPRPICMQALL